MAYSPVLDTMSLINSATFLKYSSTIPFCGTYIPLSLNLSIICSDISLSIASTSCPIVHSIWINSAFSIFFFNTFTKLVFPVPHFPAIAIAYGSLSPWDSFNSAQILFNCLCLDANNCFSSFTGQSSFSIFKFKIFIFLLLSNIDSNNLITVILNNATTNSILSSLSINVNINIKHSIILIYILNVIFIILLNVFLYLIISISWIKNNSIEP